MLFYQEHITLQPQFPMRQYSLCAPGTPLLPAQPSSEIRVGSRQTDSGSLSGIFRE